jgi:hypothetical protein
MFPNIHRDKSKPHPAITETWIKRRFELWKRTAWKSIKNQTYDDFVYVVCCSHLAEDITSSVFKEIADPRVYVAHGSLPPIRAKIKEWSSGMDEIVTLRLDSDDMYHPRAAQDVMEYKGGREWMIFKRGYGYDMASGSMYAYDTRRSGPFFAHRWDAGVFSARPGIGEIGHHRVWAHKPAILPKFRFVVNVTGMNTSTRVGMKNFLFQIGGKSAVQAKKVFGL